MRFILIIALCFSVVAESAEKDWVYDEVLTQLHELRGEMKSLNNELTQIKAEMKKLSSQRVAAKPAKPDLNLSGVFTTGSNNASIAVVEFSDYECPFCKRHHNATYGKLKKNYIDTGKVRYAMMDFPLSFHRQAEGAAVAARCAGKQGKFWQMRDALFDAKEPLGESLYRKLADNIALKSGDFERCLKDKSMVVKVNRQMDYGSQLGVQGTPAFFIGKIEGGKVVNPRLLSGAQAYNRFSTVIDDLLKGQ